MTNNEELRKRVQSAGLTEYDNGCDGADECCGNCGGERLDEDKVLSFLQREIEAAERRRTEEVIEYLDSLHSSEATWWATDLRAKFLPPKA